MTRLSLRPRAIAVLSSCPEEDRTKLKAALGALERGTFPPHTKKIIGTKRGYRTRVGRWRILFVLRPGEVDVADIFMKKGRGNYRKRFR